MKSLREIYTGKGKIELEKHDAEMNLIKAQKILIEESKTDMVETRKISWWSIGVSIFGTSVGIISLLATQCEGREVERIKKQQDHLEKQINQVGHKIDSLSYSKK